jgi:hypothetical protein
MTGYRLAIVLVVVVALDSELYGSWYAPGVRRNCPLGNPTDGTYATYRTYMTSLRFDVVLGVIGYRLLFIPQGFDGV